MGVLIKLADGKAGVNGDAVLQSERELLQTNLGRWTIPYELPIAVNSETATGPVVIRESFTQLADSIGVVPSANGFVTGLISAYHQGLHLRLRPDDVCLSILSQLRAYAYRHPGSMPELSSSHDLDLDLSIDLNSDPETEDFTYLQDSLCALSHKFVNDAGLRDWLMPNFSTTSTADLAVYTIVMMGNLRKSTEPEYDFRSQPGLASIHLLGEKLDWEDLLRRVEGRVPTFGEEALEWSKLLMPVIKGMISSIDSPDLPQTQEFWRLACHLDGVDVENDKQTLTGWITAFCFWSNAGFCLHPKFIDENNLHHPRRRNSINEFSRGEEPQIFWNDDKDDWYATKVTDRKQVSLEDVKYHHIFLKNIPSGTTTALTYVRDHFNRNIYSVTMVAGSMGTIPIKVGYLRDETVLQSWSGWYMLQDGVQAMAPRQDRTITDAQGHEVIVLD